MRFSLAPGGGVQLGASVGSLMRHRPPKARLRVPYRIVFPFLQMKTSVVVNSAAQSASYSCPMEMRYFDLSLDKKWATWAAKGRSGSMKWLRWADLIQHPSGSLIARPSFVGSIFSSGASTVTTCVVHHFPAMPYMSTSSIIVARGATVFEELCSKLESIKLIVSEFLI